MWEIAVTTASCSFIHPFLDPLLNLHNISVNKSNVDPAHTESTASREKQATARALCSLGKLVGDAMVQCLESLDRNVRILDLVEVLSRREMGATNY